MSIILVLNYYDCLAYLHASYSAEAGEKVTLMRVINSTSEIAEYGQVSRLQILYFRLASTYTVFIDSGVQDFGVTDDSRLGSKCLLCEPRYTNSS